MGNVLRRACSYELGSPESGICTRVCVPASILVYCICVCLSSFALQLVLRQVIIPLVMGLGLLAFVVQNGKHLVCKPQLCPQLAVTVVKPPKTKK